MREAFDRRRLLKITSALVAASALPLRAQDNRVPLRIIVPLPAGGVADTSVRFFADQWTALTRQTVVVDNRPGGNYQIGMQQLLNAPADGNTWIHLNPSMSATQVTFRQFDMTRQLAMLGMMGTTPGALFVAANSPMQTPKDLLDWVRANPAAANYGANTGGLEHMTTVTMLKRAGAAATLVAFRGGPDACTALAQNEIQFVMSALPLIVPFKGRIRPLVVMSEQRSAMMPQVPTFREAGLDSPGLNYWGAFGVPAATPAATVAALNRTMSEVLRAPELSAKLVPQGMAAAHNSPGEMAAIVAGEVKWMGPVASELNLKAG